MTFGENNAMIAQIPVYKFIFKSLLGRKKLLYESSITLCLKQFFERTYVHVNT